jgi:hypothetical protein
VCISRGESGPVAAVRLYEFKTGKAPHGAGLQNVPPGHALQLEANRRVIAAATGIPVEQVRAALVYVSRSLLVVGGDTALPE